MESQSFPELRAYLLLLGFNHTFCELAGKPFEGWADIPQEVFKDVAKAINHLGFTVEYQKIPEYRRTVFFYVPERMGPITSSYEIHKPFTL